MKYHVDIQQATEVQSGNGHGAYPLLNADNGCTNGCSTGVSYYRSTQYTPPAMHDDQEGFYVLEGEGTARIGGQEFPIYPGVSFIAPAGTVHQIRASVQDRQVTLFWFHAQA